MEDVEIVAKRIVELIDTHAVDNSGKMNSDHALALVTGCLAGKEVCDEVSDMSGEFGHSVYIDWVPAV